MYAFRQIIEDPQDFVAIPPELRHRRTEVIFIAIDQEVDDFVVSSGQVSLASLAGSWEGEPLTRSPQGDFENRRKLD